MEITLDNWNGSHCKGKRVYHINSSGRDFLEISEEKFRLTSATYSCKFSFIRRNCLMI